MSKHPTSPLELDRATMRRLAARVTDAVTEHIATLREQPAQLSMSRAEARSLIAAPAPEGPTDFEELMGFLQERVFPYHAREPHPHFMGYIPSSPTFPSILGDWLATGYNFFAGVWSVAAGPNELELLVLDWFNNWLGMPDGSSGILTSGGSTATVTAVVAARHAKLGAESEDISRLVLYTSDQTHSAAARAAWIAGISRSHVRAIPTDDRLRMRTDALADAINADRAAGFIPFMVVGTAGTTNTGAVDPLDSIAKICREQELWLHVDAAFGGFAALTEGGPALLKGIGEADSITLDPHKWFFINFECGCLLVRDPRALDAAFSVHPEFLTDVLPAEAEVNFADMGEQLTRYSRALKVWLSVRYFGLAAMRDAIQAGISRAEYAEKQLRARANDFEVLSPAQLGIICFRAHPRGMDDVAALDTLNERINTRVNGSGKFLMSSTRLRGAYSLRLCTQVHRMTNGDIDEVIAAIEAEMASGS